MHELSLYGQISKNDYLRVRQQLAGTTRMQPLDLEEIHVVLKARSPPGTDKVQSAGGTQGIQQQDVQKIRTMLSSGIYYVQLIGDIKSQPSMKLSNQSTKPETEVEENDEDKNHLPSAASSVDWTFEFKDTPESGKQIASSRLISRVPFEEGDLIGFMTAFGYEYVSRYYVQGCKFFDQETTIRLSRILQLPSPTNAYEACDISKLSNTRSLRPLDGSESYMVQASVDLVDGNNQDLKDRGIKQLLAMKETLRQAVDLTPGDRLALDTRIAITARR